jgi:hypothetical protein
MRRSMNDCTCRPAISERSSATSSHVATRLLTLSATSVSTTTATIDNVSDSSRARSVIRLRRTPSAY